MGDRDWLGAVRKLQAQIAAIVSVVGSGGIPLADPTGVTIDSTTYSDSVTGSGDLVVVVGHGLVANAIAAFAKSGDAYPRMIIAANGYLVFGDGTFDPWTDGGSITPLLSNPFGVAVGGTSPDGNPAALAVGSSDMSAHSSEAISALRGMLDVHYLGTSNTVSPGTPGSLVKSMPLFDSTGALLGYIPVYEDTTPAATTVTANSGSAYTIPDSVSHGGFVFLTFNAATPTITMPTPVAGARFTGVYIQDGTGSRVPSFTPAPNYGSAGAPTLSTPAGAKDTITYFSDGTDWFAFTTGLAF